MLDYWAIPIPILEAVKSHEKSVLEFLAKNATPTINHTHLDIVLFSASWGRGGVIVD